MNGERAKTYEQLKKIIIPQCVYEKSSLVEALAHVFSRTLELDAAEPDPSKKGVSIHVYGPDFVYSLKGDIPDPFDKIKINYKARNKTFIEVIQEIAEQANMDLHITSVGVVFCVPGISPVIRDGKPHGKLWKTLRQQPMGEE